MSANTAVARNHFATKLNDVVAAQDGQHLEGGADDHEFGGDYSVPEGALSVEARSAMDK